MDYYIYLLIIILLTIIPQVIVEATYSKYARVSLTHGKTGEELVNEMLNRNGITNVSLARINGRLTDHYDSRRKLIALSRDNFGNPTVASVAIASHETGHAIQDNMGYVFLRMRQSLGPATIVASRLMWIFIYLGFIFFFAPLIYVGIALLSIVVLFDLVTLPVEINASKRGKQYLISTGEYSIEDIAGVSQVLTAAAFTYVAATLAGVLQLLRLISRVKR